VQYSALRFVSKPWVDDSSIDSLVTEYGVISLIRLFIFDIEAFKRDAAADLVMELKKLVILCKEVQNSIMKQRRRNLGAA
jgi:hypothetical protein